MKSADKLSKLQKAVSEHILSSEELRSLVMEEVEFNAKLLKDGEKGISPRLVVHCKKSYDAPMERIICMIVDMPLDDDKHKLFEQIGYQMATEKDINPIAITMCSEVWIKKVDKKDKKEYDKSSKAVREYDDKEEGIMVSACTIDRRELAALVMVTRDEKGGFIPGKIDFMENVEAILLRKFYHGFVRGIRAKEVGNA